MRRLTPPVVLVAIAIAALLTAGVVAIARDGDGAETGPAPTERTTSSAAPSSTTTAAPSSTTTEPTPTATTVDVHALVPPKAAEDPVGLARQIEQAERVLRDPSASEVAVAEAALAHQVAYRKLGVHPEMDEALFAALPPDLHASATANLAARREFRRMHRTLASTLPAWEIIPPRPAEELLGHYREAEAEFGIPWNVLAAINLVETGMGRINGLSVAGAQGPMQFMPATWEAYGEGGDVHDPRDAIRGAARYLAANNGAQDLDHALWRYNHSDAYVRGVKLYAGLIAEHPRAFLTYYHWGIWYLTEAGDVYLPVGYHETEPVPVAEHLARHPRP